MYIWAVRIIWIGQWWFSQAAGLYTKRLLKWSSCGALGKRQLKPSSAYQYMFIHIPQKHAIFFL